MYDTRWKKLHEFGLQFSFNTESHNAWRVHELIVGFFSRRELGPPVLAEQFHFSSYFQSKQCFRQVMTGSSPEINPYSTGCQFHLRHHWLMLFKQPDTDYISQNSIVCCFEPFQQTHLLCKLQHIFWSWCQHAKSTFKAVVDVNSLLCEYCIQCSCSEQEGLEEGKKEEASFVFCPHNELKGILGTNSMPISCLDCCV